MKLLCNRIIGILISFFLVLSCVSPFLIHADTMDGILYGIDVSSWQDTINWPLVYDDGCRFSFVKATEGVGWTDSLFEINMIEGSSAGLLMGAYHFATPKVDDAVDEAEYFVEIAGDYINHGYLRPVLDLEQGSSLGLIVLSNWVHTWMQTVETLTGVEPMIYVNSNYANNYLSPSIAQYPLWIAHWTYDPNTAPDIGIWNNWSFWQYSDQGSIEGISGYVDLNVFNGDILELESFVIKNDIVYVDDDADPSWYDATHVHTIQEGIDNASIDDTVFVFNGTYFENVIVYKSIDLIGEDRNDTVIDGKNGNAVNLTVDSINISGFLIENSTMGIYCFDINNTIIYENNFRFNEEYGIYLESSFNTTIKGNIVDFVDYDIGIYLKYSSYNTISDNSVSHCFDGIVLYYSCHNNMIVGNDVHSNNESGVILYYANNNTLIQNAVSENHYGIGIGESSNNTIINNTVLDNVNGISLALSNCNTLSGNDVHSNNYYGVIFSTANNNKIYHNNFINNTINSNDDGSNIWDDGYSSGGNYWDDYTGTDDDGDGFGDTPYDISGGSNQDNYPFIEYDGWLKDIDVDQTSYDRGFPIRHAIDGDWGASQSFKLSRDSMTRVDIYMRKFGTPEFNLTFEIRKASINGLLIESFVFEPDEVDNSYQWIILDLEDIITIPDTEYFIVCPPAPSGVTTSFGYEWGYAFGDQYDGGAFWFTRDGGGLWRDLPTMYEFAFRTYGYD